MDNPQILELLKSVKYPGFSRDIVSFGLIKEITINNDTINIDLALKTKNEEKKEIQNTVRETTEMKILEGDLEEIKEID